jgi:transcriptional regulator with XRE-family HTH domain
MVAIVTVGRPRLAPIIEAARKRQGLFQVELAALVGVSDRTVAKWEKGQVIPRRRHLAKLSEELNLDLTRVKRLAIQDLEARRNGRLA